MIFTNKEQGDTYFFNSLLVFGMKQGDDKLKKRIVFPRHDLPNQDKIYAISEVIIRSNDQHKKKKINKKHE